MYDHKNTILFYGRKFSHFEFSNFYKSPIRIYGKNWPSTEHYYQAMKFYPKYPKMVEKIRNSRTAFRAKKLAAKYERYLCPLWCFVRIFIMEKALR